jgi:hypothetical protein
MTALFWAAVWATFTIGSLHTIGATLLDWHRDRTRRP